MNNIKIIESKESTNIEEIRKFEKLIGAELPKDYVDFILRYNGGHPIADTYDLIEPINENETFSGIEWFYPFGEQYKNNVIRYYSLFKDRLPNDFIRIASASCGNDICICVRGENYGKVYLWDHENEAPEGQEPWYDNVYLIANSFTEFMDKLYEVELDDEGNLVRIS